MANPKRRGDVVLSEVDDDLIVFDPTTGQAHLLNPTAAAIFELCDGQSNAATLGTLIAGTLGVKAEVVQPDLLLALEELATLGLLEPSGAE